MLAEAISRKRFNDLWKSSGAPYVAPFRQAPVGCTPLQHGLQHALAGYAEHVRQYTAQLDIGVLQRLLDAVPLAGGIRSIAAFVAVSGRATRGWLEEDNEACSDHVVPPLS